MRQSTKATLGQLLYRAGEFGGLGLLVFGAVRISERMGSGHIIDRGALVIDGALYFIGAIVLFLAGWLLRLSLTGERHLI
jgi:hypothetical protein